MRYMVFDSETTIAEKYKRKANCFIKDNWVVAEGWKFEGDSQCSYRYMDEPASKSSYLAIPDDVGVLVAFNIKFDLLWELVRTNRDLEKFLKRGGKIWCCQYAEYLLRAQHPDWQMCNLNDTAIAHGGEPKIDAVKAMWDEGINTPDIPKDLLIDYLIGTEDEDRNGGDIGNTEIVYLGQIKQAEKLGMTKMIEDRMDGLLSTTFMEFAGLKIDVDFARQYLKEQTAALAVQSKILDEYIPELPPELEFKWSSNQHKSCLIFGGAIPYKKQMTYTDEKTGELARLTAVERWPVFNGEAINPTVNNSEFKDDLWFIEGVSQDVFKGGKNIGAGKFKNVPVEGELKTRFTNLYVELPGFVKPDPKWAGSNTDALDKPLYSVGKDTMEVLLSNPKVPFLSDLGKHTALEKEIGTYLVKKDKSGKLKGMLTCVLPDTQMIHHKLNHTSTVTSRLSSSDPNMQNIPRGDKSRVKELFISRWEDGRKVEADYSQLEVVVQGVLTKDKQLEIDLLNKIDFHCKRVSMKKDCTYEEALYRCKTEAYERYKEWSEYRTGAKIFSFQRAYGAGAKTIANDTGMTVEDVEELIALEMKAYPMVEEYYKDVEREIESTSEPFRGQRENGSWGYFRRGYYTAPTGTRYTWRSYDAPAFLKKRGVQDQFAQPEIRNYPVQGTGGEFVQAMLGKLIRHLLNVDFYGKGMFDPSAVLCNTVHDCVWFDCMNEELSKQVWTDIKPIMESIPEFYNKRHGMDIRVPFPVDGEVGTNMNNLAHFPK